MTTGPEQREVKLLRNLNVNIHQFEMFSFNYLKQEKKIIFFCVPYNQESISHEAQNEAQTDKGFVTVMCV